MIFQSKESKLFVGIGNDELACVTKIEISSERGLTSAGDVDKTSAVHTGICDAPDHVLARLMAQLVLPPRTSSGA